MHRGKDEVDSSNLQWKGRGCWEQVGWLLDAGAYTELLPRVVRRFQGPLTRSLAS